MNQLKLISKYRGQLMGLATICVILHHASLERYIDIYAFKFIHGSVDIFFFLSGFGLLYSSLKKESLATFYLKRFIRVLPAFIIVCLLSIFIYLNSDFTWSAYIGKILSYDFWNGKAIQLWYVSGILVLYLFFPLYMYIFKKSPYLLTFVCIVMGIALTWFTATYVLSFKPYFNVLFLSRIPIFSIGVLFGWLSLKEGRIVTPKFKLSLYISSLLGFIILAGVFYTNTPYMWYGLMWFPFILIIPGLVIFLSNLFDKYLNVFCSKTLSFFGNISLELYLIHVLLFLSRDYYVEKTGVDFLPLTLFFLALSVLLAYMLSFVTQYISTTANKYINRKTKKNESI